MVSALQVSRGKNGTVIHDGTGCPDFVNSGGEKGLDYSPMVFYG
jgi:hypothetical protein